MVKWATPMTMSVRGNHWSVADAKAQLSELIQKASEEPQTIERRGRAVVVVVSVDQFHAQDAGARWRRFLDVSAEVRAEGGADLRVPRRSRRRSPFARS